MLGRSQRMAVHFARGDILAPLFSTGGAIWSSWWRWCVHRSTEGRCRPHGFRSDRRGVRAILRIIPRTTFGTSCQGKNMCFAFRMRARFLSCRMRFGTLPLGFSQSEQRMGRSSLRLLIRCRHRSLETQRPSSSRTGAARTCSLPSHAS